MLTQPYIMLTGVLYQEPKPSPEPYCPNRFPFRRRPRIQTSDDLEAAMGRGKRGRTQRRHFKEGRENVWQYNSKRNRPDDAAAAAADPNNPTPTPTHWEPFETQNPGFELYYKAQGIVPEEEWDEFIRMLRKPLPAAFRINSSGQFAKDIRAQLENDFMRSLEVESNNECETEAIRPLPWYPHKLAWHSNFSRMQLRKNQTLERFHEFLKQENEVGNITRQEAVSMVPPLFLDVLPNHHVLDMCAAPGSKTFQLLEIIHQSIQPGSIPDGLVIANDVDVQRCNLLIHQTKRMCTANLIVTNHEAQHFPSCSLTRDCLETSKEDQVDTRKQILQFDRVLCDVPCSGDGTLRKAPDIWRKWNAGNGNGVHRLQVEIAMRGIMLLKVGGRMVYSTCSMNPVENEAVVAEVLRRCGKSVELLNVSGELPELIRRPGLKTWKVRDKGAWIASYGDAPTYRRSVLVPSMFPCDRVLKETHTVVNGVLENSMANGSEIEEEKIDTEGIRHKDGTSVVQENNTEKLENEMNLGAPCEPEEASKERASVEDLVTDVEVEVSAFPLERCMRILPHDQNGGAFFVAVFQKLSQVIPENNARGTSNNCSEKVENELKSETKPSQDVPCQDFDTVVHATSDTNLITDQSPGMATEVGVESYSEDVGSKDADTAEAEACDNGEIVKMASKGAKGKSQSESKWRGVDPVVFFTDETTINSIKSFYGISESFPLDGHLVARNTDLNHVKRIYYVSKSVQNILQLNFQVGQRLKITSLGLKIFERQTAKEPTSPCAFRLSSEALPLLLPYISKQILSATLADFHHLLKYRVVKFKDFVVADLGDKASKLMAGCCVVVLNEGGESSDTFSVDASTIAIICWKGKTNVSIMVSQLDAQELLSRLSARFGIDASPGKNENDAAEDTVDDEQPEPTEDADMEAI